MKRYKKGCGYKRFTKKINTNRSILLLSSFCLLILTNNLISKVWAEEKPIIHDKKFSLEMRALPYSAIKAFFLARGFLDTEAVWIAESGCVFKFAAAHDGNSDEQSVHMDLTTFRVKSNDDWKQLAFRESWTQSWQEKNVSKAAQIAFHWALFPSQQTFHPGDRNWGMVPMGFKPETPFDLKAVWYSGEKRSETILKNLKCAPIKDNP